MKQNHLIFSLSVTAFILSLILALISVIPGLVAAQSVLRARPDQAQSVTPHNLPLVQVITTAMAQQQTVTVLPAPVPSTCNIDSLNTGNLVQDTGLINLNAPSVCFTLAGVRSAPVQITESLVVVSPVITAMIKVLEQPDILGPVLAEHLPAAELPIIPVVSMLGLVILFIYIAKQDPEEYRVRKIQPALSSVSLSFLQILRC